MVLLLVALPAGCGKSGNEWPVAHLQGQVTIGGKPVPSDVHQARIVFTPSQSGANRRAKAVMVSIVNGRYDAPDVPVGPLTVSFDISRYTGEERQLDGNRGTVKISESLVPQDAWGGIAYEAAEDDSTKDFDL
jgi:hypothetical protein